MQELRGLAIEELHKNGIMNPTEEDIQDTIKQLQEYYKAE